MVTSALSCLRKVAANVMMTGKVVVRDSAAEQARYAGKYMLAPMVRIGTLPMRLLALKYGAHLSYTEELIDHKLIMCSRIENKTLGTTDFVLQDGTIVFRTCPAEKNHVIFQMGTADPARALQAALLVCNDVAGIDINMGCPKDYSVAGGMGAALLSKPDTIRDILTTLVAHVPVPITCKIRILPTIEQTVALAKMIESTGVAALGVHGRFVPERPRMPAHYEYIKAVAQALTIPVIANGGSLDHLDYAGMVKFKERTGCSSVMMARAAMWNPSVFRPEGLLPVEQCVAHYLKIGLIYGNRYENSKYCILQMLHEDLTSPLGRKVFDSKDYADVCDTFGITEELALWQQREREEEERKIAEVAAEEETNNKRAHEGDVVERPVKFIKHQWKVSDTPKTVLLNWSRRQKIDQPAYAIEERPGDRHFRATVIVDGKQYRHKDWDKNKKMAEQAAAMAALAVLNISA